MKNKHITFAILIIFIIIIGCFLVFKNSNKNKNSTITKSLKELNVISQYNDYVLSIENNYSELETYAIYKATNSGKYERQFSLLEGESVESRFVCWTNDKIYILGNNPISYNLINGKIENRGNLSKMINETTGKIDFVIGIKDNFIYYAYSYNANNFYGKIDLDLKQPITIEKSDIPENLTK